MRRAVRTRPNVISISCLRTRVGLHISDTVGGPTTAGARRMHSPRDAFFMAATWGRVGKRWSPAASGLSTADGWTPASSRLDWCRPCPRVEIPRTSKYFISAQVIDTVRIPIFANPPEFRVVGLSSHAPRILAAR